MSTDKRAYHPSFSRIARPAMLSALAIVAASCSMRLPKEAACSNEEPKTCPDYSGVTIPCNIAPLNFRIDENANKYLTHIHEEGKDGFTISGQVVKIPVNKWKSLIANLEGNTICLDVHLLDSNGWKRCSPIRLAIAEEIDPYISYRKIEPSYIGFETMKICQRSLENYKEVELLNNRTMSQDDKGQCINCHSYQDYNSEGNMQMHVRVNLGGTVIVHDGEARKVNLKTPKTISAGVYPSWHPDLPVIAYSTNTTTQSFHSLNSNKIEVQDGASDIVLYHLDSNQLQIISNDSTQLESFPYWNHDGSELYYVSAKTPYLEGDALEEYKSEHYKDYKYDILRRSFDPETRSFGPADTVFAASASGASATFPRESRDGRFLVFTMAEYGTFHIWHRDADLYLMDLKSGEVRKLDELNSPETESYHSFSSNGRWLLFSSRRDDGSFTRLYIAHFDENGHFGKPFLLPQRNPDSNLELYKSYNVPEFMVKSAAPLRNKIRKAIESEALSVKLCE